MFAKRNRIPGHSHHKGVSLTATGFKTRWRYHQMSFKHEKKRNDPELSKFLWELLKEKKE